MKAKPDTDQYRFTVRRLAKEEGGGWLVEYPDIPGCMSEGESIDEAIANGRQAPRDRLAVFREIDRVKVVEAALLTYIVSKKFSIVAKSSEFQYVFRTAIAR